MMRFRTEIEPVVPDRFIDHSTEVMLVGSCFSDEIGRRMRAALFDVDVNPFGTLYNPLSISEAITDALDLKYFSRDELFLHEGRYHTFRRHSAFSMADPDEMLRSLNDRLDAAARHLVSARLLIITLGSAIAFFDTESRRIVANCHKQPARRFERIILDTGSIVKEWSALLSRLQSLNPTLKIMLTVSPVRHAGYGLELDRLSKSILIVAAHTLCTQMPDCRYFPSYEMVVDDLRDYRFYDEDMAHPSEQAVEYVYHYFCNAFMRPESLELGNRCAAIGRTFTHRGRDEAATAQLRADARQRLEQLAANAGLPQLTERFNSLYPIQ